MDINKIKGREPLIEYPWQSEVDRLLKWLIGKDDSMKAFCFDIIMSAAYIDATAGLEENIEFCPSTNHNYNAHLGFINLCSPCFEVNQEWIYQKAVKPQSGVLGKLSSEIILRFIDKLFPNICEVIAIGGVAVADAILKHTNGTIILAEVKSAPLLTYPFLFKVQDSNTNGIHEKLTITTSQLHQCNSAIYLHGENIIELGKVGNNQWPFKPIVDFITNEKNKKIINESVAIWNLAKKSYIDRNKKNKMYYLSNACGNPPKIAKDRDSWPQRVTISDGKTSAGMDRTDDIKKGIYQVLKIGTEIKHIPEYKTALISNLPAYRHRNEYVEPFINMLWGLEENIEDIKGEKSIKLDNLRRVFDFIITLEEPILRDIEL